MITPVEASSFSLAASRRINIPPTPGEATENQALAAQIAVYSTAHMGERRFETLPDGHLRIYTIGEQLRYDSDRRIYVDELRIGMEETKTKRRNEDGVEEEYKGYVDINPYCPPWTTIEIHEHFPSGATGQITSAHLSLPMELRTVLTALTTGVLTDPRPTNWRVVAVSAEQAPLGTV